MGPATGSGSSSSPAGAAGSGPRSPRSSVGGGAYVVTMDPLVSLDGAEQLPAAEETTAGRIVAAGGSARASSVSVTDGDAVRGLFADLVDGARPARRGDQRGRHHPPHRASPVGARRTGSPCSSVHLDGYLNMLGAALPIMAAAGHGRILGVTSGSGWRPADTGAYGCAKRAVAALTWQLGPARAPRRRRQRHVADRRDPHGHGGARTRPGQALAPGAGPSATGGLVARLDAHARAARTDRRPPRRRRLRLVQRPGDLRRGVGGGGDRAAPPARGRAHRRRRPRWLTVLETVTAGALAPAEVRQVSNGGSNPRFGPAFDGSVDGDPPPSAVSSCAVVTDRPGADGRDHRGAGRPGRAVPDDRGRGPHDRLRRRGRRAGGQRRARRPARRRRRRPRAVPPRRPARAASGSGCSPSTPASSEMSTPTRRGSGRWPTTRCEPTVPSGW